MNNPADIGRAIAVDLSSHGVPLHRRALTRGVVDHHSVSTQVFREINRRADKGEIQPSQLADVLEAAAEHFRLIVGSIEEAKRQVLAARAAMNGGDETRPT